MQKHTSRGTQWCNFLLHSTFQLGVMKLTQTMDYYSLLQFKHMKGTCESLTCNHSFPHTYMYVYVYTIIVRQQSEMKHYHRVFTITKCLGNCIHCATSTEAVAAVECCHCMCMVSHVSDMAYSYEVCSGTRDQVTPLLAIIDHVSTVMRAVK